MSDAGAGLNYRGPLLAAVFDWAGTVLDYGSRAPVAAVMQTFASFEAPITVEEARGPMGMAKRDHIQAVLNVPRVADLWRSAHGAPPDHRAVDRIYERFLATQLDVLKAHCKLIPGCLETMAYCRERGMRLGSSTGYTRELMNIVVPAARRQGLDFDAVVCADDVPQGRPAPWMCLENARRLGVYPMRAIVAVDDTRVGVEAGLNAGMWTVAVAKSGNSVGLGFKELEALPPDEQRRLVGRAHDQLQAAGAHYVIDSVAELPDVLAAIDRALSAGESL
jgi:phosphonoacetaldehyde hydrolase